MLRLKLRAWEWELGLDGSGRGQHQQMLGERVNVQTMQEVGEGPRRKIQPGFRATHSAAAQVLVT